MRLVFLAAPFLAGAFTLVAPDDASTAGKSSQLTSSSDRLEFSQDRPEGGMSRSSLKLTLIGADQQATITDVQIVGPGASQYSIQSFPGLVLTDRWSELQIGFSPTSANGPTDATMVISTDNPDTPPLKVPLTVSRM
jgi:hypothetical protein